MYFRPHLRLPTLSSVISQNNQNVICFVPPTHIIHHCLSHFILLKLYHYKNMNNYGKTR